MNTKPTEPRITIQAKDNDGTVKNLTCLSWSKITGSPTDTIRYLYRRNKSGKINISNRQVIGLDELPKPAFNKNAAITKKQKAITRNQLMSAFLRKRLVPGN